MDRLSILFISAMLIVSSVMSASDKSYVKILSPEGQILQNTNQFKAFLTSKVVDKATITTTVINSCEANMQEFDEVFCTALSSDDGLKVSASSNQLLLTPTFENLNSDNYFGCKVLELSCYLSQNMCILVSAKDFANDKACFEQCTRRIVKSICDLRSVRTTSPPVTFTVIVDTAGSDLSLEQGSFSKLLKDYIDETGKEFYKGSLDSVLKVSVMFADFQNKNSLTIAQSNLQESLPTTSSCTDFTVGSFVSNFYSKWTEIASDVPKPVYTKEERQSLFVIESAYTLGLSQIEAAIASWQKRVGSSGKLVGKFSDRVRSLLQSVLNTYKLRTSGTLTLRERNRRALELKDTLKQAVNSLFNQQITILQSKMSNKLKETLLAIPEYTKEVELQTLRNLLFEFKTAMADLEIEEFNCKLTPAIISEFSSVLQEIAVELPESPQAKLEIIRRMDIQAKAQKKKKGTSGVNIGLNLVGMLRPAGFGNLQGFVNYGTSLLGLPLELLLGFQNDGDSPDIMGEDREYPLLRLQPKIHLDIDT